MVNLDFGTDWGNSAAYSFKNGHYFLGLIQEVNGMAEVIMDFSAAYLGAGFLGAGISGIGTTFTIGSLTSGYLDFKSQINNTVDNYSNSLANSFYSISNNITIHFGRYKTLSTTTADQVNKFLAETKGLKPPYKSGTNVSILQLKRDTKFVRVYDNKVSFEKGPWIMREKDIKGLSPAEIQKKYSLPFTPVYQCDVNLKAGTLLRSGIAGPLFGMPGGGLQYDLMINGKNIDDFVNGRLIK